MTILPHINAKKVSIRGNSQESINLKSVFQTWLNDKNTNLFLLIGEFGSGKTQALKKFITEETQAGEVEVLNFAKLVELNEGSDDLDIIDHDADILVFDNYDAVNSYSGYQVNPPDLRTIQSQIENGKRVILVSRRKHTEANDELIKQLKNKTRTSRFNIKNPVTYLVVPWELEEIREYADETDNNYLLNVSKFIEKLPLNQRRHFLRPLTISILVGKGEKLNIDDTHSNLLDIYKEFCEIAIASDYDKKRSKIPTTLKDKILKDLAKDIFTGENDADGLLISKKKVEERVSSHMFDAGLLDNRTEYNWTQDFISTVINFQNSNTEQKGASDKGLPMGFEYCEFVDSSFYEYYLADSIVDDIFHCRPLGLSIDRLSSNVIDVVSLVFVKEWTDDDILRKNLRKIFNDCPNLSVADKIIYLYLLEDDPQYLELLKSMPSAYIEEISDLESSLNSLFILNIIRFQLVANVTWGLHQHQGQLKELPAKDSLKEEIKIHQSEEGLAEALLLRLQNPNLSKAAEIFIYRLGQLGHQPALPFLKVISAQTKNLKLQKVVDEAVKKLS